LGDKEKHPLVILLKGIPGNPLENPHQYPRQKDVKILHHKDSSTMFDGTATTDNVGKSAGTVHLMLLTH